MHQNSKVFIAGHRGLVGSALTRLFIQKGFSQLILRTKEDLDLRDGQAVHHFFKKEKPEYVLLAAAKVGGIFANFSEPAPFLYDNLAIQNNVIHSAFLYGVKRFLFLGSSCIYPVKCPQPIHESDLLTGPLEITNEAYAIAKIAGIKMCEAYNKQYGTKFVALMPTNLYGPQDHFDPIRSHVIPAMILKVDRAMEKNEKNISFWGTGSPRREFLYVDDLAQACYQVMNLSETEFQTLFSENQRPIINVGYGSDLPVKELVQMIANLMGYSGEWSWDSSKPDGTERKLLDSSRIQKIGWRPQVSLEEGLSKTIAWYQKYLKPTLAHRL